MESSRFPYNYHTVYLLEQQKRAATSSNSETAKHGKTVLLMSPASVTVAKGTLITCKSETIFLNILG